MNFLSSATGTAPRPCTGAVVATLSHVFELPLGNQHAIEGIPVRACQASSPLRVEHRDVKRCESLAGDAAGDVSSHVQRAWKLAEPGFGRDFPR